MGIVFFFGMTFFYSYGTYAGARSCIGRKYTFFFQISSKKKHSNQSSFFFFDNRFAETEAVAVLSIFVSQFKMTVKEEPQFAAETFEQRKARILSVSLGLTTTWVFPWMIWSWYWWMCFFFCLPSIIGLFVFLWFSLVVHKVTQTSGEEIN